MNGLFRQCLWPKAPLETTFVTKYDHARGSDLSKITPSGIFISAVVNTALIKFFSAAGVSSVIGLGVDCR